MPSLETAGAIGVTACAAILVGSLLILHSGSLRARTYLALGFSGWFAGLAVLSGLQIFDPIKGLGIAAFGAAVGLPLLVLIFLGVHRSHWRGVLLEMPLAPLIAIHVVRILPGFFFLVLYADARLPAPFAPTAGWGDIATGLLALPVAMAFAGQLVGARLFVVAWSILGIADLALALLLGALSAPEYAIHPFADGTSMTDLISLPWILIPAYIVPTLLCIHLLILVRVARAYRSVDGPSAAAARIGA